MEIGNAGNVWKKGAALESGQGVTFETSVRKDFVLLREEYNLGAKI